MFYKFYVNNFVEYSQDGPLYEPMLQMGQYQIQHTVQEYYGISKTHGLGYINFTLSPNNPIKC